MNILLVTEQREGKWNKTCFETLAAAQQISNETKGRLAAAVIGKGVAGLAGELAATKLDEVLLVEHDLLAAYTPDGYSLALQQAIAQAKPDLVLLPHTYQVRDFAPKLAASLGKGMIGLRLLPSPKRETDFCAPDVPGQNRGGRGVRRRVALVRDVSGRGVSRRPGRSWLLKCA